MSQLLPEFSKLFWRFSIYMGIYGFTRGFRAESSKIEYSKRQLLFSERFINGTINSYMYFLPIFNIYQLTRIVSRVEIRLRNLKKEDHESFYEEAFSGGVCNYTL